MVDDIGVVAQAPVHRVCARATVERVAKRVASQHVVQPVAGAIHRSPDQHEVLKPSPQRVAYRGFDRVGVAARLDDHIARGVHAVEVRTRAADHRVVAGTAIQRVVAGQALQPVRSTVARDTVRESVARPVDRCRPQKRQMLEIGTQHISHRRAHMVLATAGPFRDHIARIIDAIGVVPGPAHHRVNANSPVEPIVR